MNMNQITKSEYNVDSVIQCFNIPDDAFYYILLQRTSYQRSLNTYFRRANLGGVYDRYLLKLIEASRKDEISQLYSIDMQCEFETFRDFLPKNANRILDIGCGIGGIDIKLFKHYSSSETEICLLDKEGISREVYYGFEDKGAFYNSLILAKDFLAANSVPRNKISTFDIDSVDFPKGVKFDVIVSLISWGFHYPVETYLNDAYAALSDSGVVILDIRKDTNGKAVLSEKFTSVEVIHTGENHDRLLLRKRAR